jgi:predicted RNA-binding protein YlqC (UPF0109 family)
MRALVQTVYFGRQFLNAVGQWQEDVQKAMVEVEELVREIAQALVDEPAAVEVESIAREENTVLKLRVAPTDVGKVIGKQGRTARSVRTILGAVSMKLHHRYTLDILEEDDEA